nr:RNA-binding domain-containing protein [uncultured Bacteroides sp.]
MNTESQNIEFKESWRDDYLKWICGFANAQGGILYIGIKDNGDICGVQDAKKLMEDIPNKVRDMLGILVDVNKKEYPERATTQKTIQKTIQNLTEQQKNILSYLKENPNATRKELYENIPDATMGGIIHNLSRLQELGLLKRIGGRKQGYWEIIEE